MRADMYMHPKIYQLFKKQQQTNMGIGAQFTAKIWRAYKIKVIKAQRGIYIEEIP